MRGFEPFTGFVNVVGSIADILVAVGQPIPVTFLFAGGTTVFEDTDGSPMTAAVTSGSIGTCSLASGILSGTPTGIVASNTVTITATNALGASATVSFQFQVVAAVTVPSVLNDTASVAAAAIVAAGFVALQGPSLSSSTVAVGLVVAQTPGATSPAIAGSTVTYNLSSGPPVGLPILPGLTFGMTRAMEHASDIQRAISGKTTRQSLMRWPRVHWMQSYELLRDDNTVALSELKLLLGFFNSVQGRLTPFVYIDPLFNSVTQQNFGTGDGVTRTFQLTAIYQADSSSPGITEIIQNVDGAPLIYNAGVLQSINNFYTLGSTGIVEFNTAPISGHALTWSGSFFYLCIFEDDTLDFAEIFQNWWELKKLKFQSIVR